jgi:hypothetical protein
LQGNKRKMPDVAQLNRHPARVVSLVGLMRNGHCQIRR